jgi:hypothetical protein
MGGRISGVIADDLVLPMRQGDEAAARSRSRASDPHLIDGEGFPEQGKRALKWSTIKQATELAWNTELEAILRKVRLFLADTGSVSG